MDKLHAPLDTPKDENRVFTRRGNNETQRFNLFPKGSKSVEKGAIFKAGIGDQKKNCNCSGSQESEFRSQNEDAGDGI